MDEPWCAAQADLERTVAAVAQVVLGKERQIRLGLVCLLARGHLLIEDLPGMGKTTLAHAIAQVLGLAFNRVQFTSDLLPADVLGVAIYDRENASFKFHPGPIFTQLILVDEVNRATPKTQSALLEAMEERQVTVEGETRRLPEPFFVVATQNPLHQVGTFPLPESQLDRFMMRLELGYPDPLAERTLLRGRDRREVLQTLSPVLSPAQLLALQRAVTTVHVAEPLLDYVQALLAETRRAGQLGNGLSPRAGLALLRCAQAWALVSGRRHVLPEDLQVVFPVVAGHRLQGGQESRSGSGNALAAQLLEAVPIP
jgi:MoxR-like ATPase